MAVGGRAEYLQGSAQASIALNELGTESARLGGAELRQEQQLDKAVRAWQDWA